MGLFETLAEWLRPYWVLWLMGIFLAIALWAFWPRRRAEMEKHARIPLELEGDDEER